MGLADVLVAFALLLTAVFFSMNVFPTSARAARMARLNMLATHLAQSQLEQINRLPFTNIASVPARTVTVTEKMNGVTDTIQFSVSVDVSLVTGNTNLKDLVANVSWTDSGRSRNVRVETLVANMQ